MGRYILNTCYLKAKWEKDPNAAPGTFNMKKIADDALVMVIHDDDKRYPEIKIIERPEIEWYSVKDNIEPNPYNEMHLDKNKVDTHVCEYSKRETEICNYLGILDEYKKIKSLPYSPENRGLMNQFKNEKMAKSPYVYGIDTNIEDYYKTKIMREEAMTLPKWFNISFFDIETYIYPYKEKVDQNNPLAPINVITYVNNITKEFYALVLYIPGLKGIDTIRGREEDFIRDELAEDFKDMPDLKIKIKFFDSEVILLKAFFELVWRDKPEFILAWNSNYDIKYTIGRLKHYGLDPKDYFSHPDIPEHLRYCWYKEDHNRYIKPEERGGKSLTPWHRMWDWMFAPGYTCWIDQMSMYSNMRKRYLEPSYRLDAIAEKEIHARKVDLHAFGLNIKNAPYENFRLFLKYSCRDTKLLLQMETKLDDIRNFVNLSDNTRLEKGMNVSFIIKNAFYSKFLDNNEVIGNTIDYNLHESIPGAIIGDPQLVDAPSVMIDGKKTAIYQMVVDFDASSEYPSLMEQLRIGKENLINRFLMIVDDSGKYLMSGKDYNSALQTIDTSAINMGMELYGLPSIKDMIEEIQHNIS